MFKGLLAISITAAILMSVYIVERLFDRYRPVTGLWTRLAIVVLVAFAVGWAGIKAAGAHDGGQWEAADPAIREWYQALMQPDNPKASCCGEADAYWCDDYRFENGKAFCNISDDRPDAPRGRPHVDVGTEIEIPPHKLKWDRGNPTGHGVVFLSRQGFVFCYVQPGGA